MQDLPLCGSESIFVIILFFRSSTSEFGIMYDSLIMEF